MIIILILILTCITNINAVTKVATTQDIDNMIKTINHNECIYWEDWIKTNCPAHAFNNQVNIKIEVSKEHLLDQIASYDPRLFEPDSLTHYEIIKNPHKRDSGNNIVDVYNINNIKDHICNHATYAGSLPIHESVCSMYLYKDDLSHFYGQRSIEPDEIDNRKRTLISWACKISLQQFDYFIDSFDKD